MMSFRPLDGESISKLGTVGAGALVASSFRPLDGESISKLINDTSWIIISPVSVP